MGKLHPSFENAMERIGLAPAELPTAVFYHAHAGIRFEIGGEEDVYLPGRRGWNPVYVENAFFRAETLFYALPCRPNILRIDSYPQETDRITPELLSELGLPAPNELVQGVHMDEEDRYPQEHLYWDLSKGNCQTDKLLLEIIKGDIGGFSGLSSNVYFLNTEHSLLYHLYDDRGADIAADDRSLLLSLYQKYRGWILPYNRAAIDQLFVDCV